MQDEAARPLTAGTRDGGHLADLAARLEQAQACDPGGAEVAAVAAVLLAELGAALGGLYRAEDERDTAIVTMRAAVADDRDGAPDPLAHVRRYLTPRGQMPRGEESALVLLAWGPSGPPSPSGPLRHRAGAPAVLVTGGTA
jgi:hypothetical protein